MRIRTPIGRPASTAPFALPLLADGGTSAGMAAQEGLTGTVPLARTTDRRGFHRFWMSERHVTGATSVSSPPLMIARLIAARNGLPRA
ncbi:hypothetical protein ACFWTE_24790 [Nocardiopsis sp. NPDC058631]|uniref:hypothetical protein n=1 Tax=Nocardiopsis sp. NPDC058631 TaxID=3346566 RepID=UPI003652FA1D